jgi:hypothetical protein
LNKYNNEQVGISAEIAIGNLTGVSVVDKYRRRGRAELIQHISPALVETLSQIPRPISHTAERRNPIDFTLEGEKTLSVKSNKQGAGKIAPTKIGQASSTTFWGHLPQFAPKGIDLSKLSYGESAKLFKEVALTNTSNLLTAYWEHTFDCDYMIYVYDVLTDGDNLTSGPTVRLFGKIKSPSWDKSQLTFTQNLDSWNESCTVKLDDISIGEFQVHRNRNGFKFRFNFGGLMQGGFLPE